MIAGDHLVVPDEREGAFEFDGLPIQAADVLAAEFWVGVEGIGSVGTLEFGGGFFGGAGSGEAGGGGSLGRRRGVVGPVGADATSTVRVLGVVAAQVRQIK